LGQRRVVILARHILPNCVGPLAVAATLAIPEAIFIESFLAFIGIGVSAPQASWGTLASDGLSYISTAPEQLIWPAVAISVAMLAFNLFGDGLRDALDPSARR
jgi:oligopeptide transport system permease protein